MTEVTTAFVRNQDRLLNIFSHNVHSHRGSDKTFLGEIIYLHIFQHYQIFPHYGMINTYTREGEKYNRSYNYNKGYNLECVVRKK